MEFVIPASSLSAVPVVSGKSFPVRRIFCVARNYADHAREMGSDPEREAPNFFMKPADAILPNHSVMPYPPATSNLHHEIELVVALKQGGRNIKIEIAEHCIFGYAVGLDMTRRDLQAAAKAKGQPWDMSKGFDFSAPMSAIKCKDGCGNINDGVIELKVNNVVRQRGNIADMIWSVPETINQLSQLVELKAGDLIFTGTPSGVGPVNTGDVLEGRITGLEALSITIG